MNVQLPAFIERRREDILAAAERRGVRDVRVFGSFARGEASGCSDVDLLVELEPGRDIVDLAGFRTGVLKILDREVDVTTRRLLRPEAERAALADAVPLRARTPAPTAR